MTPGNHSTTPALDTPRNRGNIKKSSDLSWNLCVKPAWWIWATEENRRLATVKHLLTRARVNEIISFWQGNNVCDKRSKSGRTRLQQRPEVGGRPFWNDECTDRAARSCMFNHIHNHGYRWAKPIISPPPIVGKASTGLQLGDMNELVGCESVNGMRTPFTVQLGENLWIQRLVVFVNETTQKIGSAIGLKRNPLSINLNVILQE